MLLQSSMLATYDTPASVGMAEGPYCQPTNSMEDGWQKEFWVEQGYAGFVCHAMGSWDNVETIFIGELHNDGTSLSLLEALAKSPLFAEREQTLFFESVGSDVQSSCTHQPNHWGCRGWDIPAFSEAFSQQEHSPPVWLGEKILTQWRSADVASFLGWPGNDPVDMGVLVGHQRFYQHYGRFAELLNWMADRLEDLVVSERPRSESALNAAFDREIDRKLREITESIKVLTENLPRSSSSMVSFRESKTSLPMDIRLVHYCDQLAFRIFKELQRQHHEEGMPYWEIQQQLVLYLQQLEAHFELSGKLRVLLSNDHMITVLEALKKQPDSASSAMPTNTLFFAGLAHLTDFQENGIDKSSSSFWSISRASDSQQLRSYIETDDTNPSAVLTHMG